MQSINYDNNNYYYKPRTTHHNFHRFTVSILEGQLLAACTFHCTRIICVQHGVRERARSLCLSLWHNMNNYGIVCGLVVCENESQQVYVVHCMLITCVHMVVHTCMHTPNTFLEILFGLS